MWYGWVNVVRVIGHGVDDLVKLHTFVARDPVEVDVVLLALPEPLAGFACGEDGDDLGGVEGGTK